MSPLSSVAVSALAVRSLGSVVRPAAAATESFLDLLRGGGEPQTASVEDAAGPVGDLETRRRDIVHRLRSLFATVVGSEPAGVQASDTLRIELSPLQHVYVDGGTPWDRQLEGAVEADAGLMDALRQWFQESGQDSLEMKF